MDLAEKVAELVAAQVRRCREAGIKGQKIVAATHNQGKLEKSQRFWDH